MTTSMIIDNVRWLDAAGRLRDGPLWLASGRIRLAKPDGELGAVLNGNSGLVLPGFVDTHTHLREPGQAQKEGIDNGSHAACKGGVTTLLDMPNNVPPIVSSDRLAEKRARFAAACRCNWGLFVQAPVADPERLGPHAGVKLYMAQASALPALSDLDAVADVLGRHPRVVVHAEDETRFVPATSTTLRPHHERRPREAVLQALATVEQALASIPEARRPRLILAHAATLEEVRWLQRMKAAGFDVWGETCPHYLLLTEADYLREGARLQVNPPLRTPADRDALLAALADGTLDFIGSDHAPHTPAEKAAAAGAPSGIPGIEWLAPALLHLVDRGLFDLARLNAITSANACRCYGIRERGAIADGRIADLVLLTPEAAAGKPITRAAYEPFAHLPLRWRTEATLVNGALAYHHGRECPPTRGQEVVT
ncbi:MAG: dihydroorotase family protein [Deltaproteobacteria bacterium]|nr:dihydroorotase family protein [Deltaproteobacteria bacterium]